MSLLDESLANSRALGRRPVMERGLLSRRARRKASPADGKTNAVGRSCRAWLHCTGC